MKKLIIAAIILAAMATTASANVFRVCVKEANDKYCDQFSSLADAKESYEITKKDTLDSYVTRTIWIEKESKEKGKIRLDIIDRLQTGKIRGLNGLDVTKDLNKQRPVALTPPPSNTSGPMPTRIGTNPDGTPRYTTPLPN